MINKLFKTIFILSLCLGISLPSFSAVSVSDGSAFVTKTELDADLNNLDNRMALLENSLDAKIDSLVSSYLTRNGIWNGRGQELSSYCSLSNDPTPAKYYKLYQSGKRANFNAIVDNLTDSKYVIVSNVDKTGLAHVQISTYGTGLFITKMDTGTWPYKGYRSDDTYFTGHEYMRDGVRYSGAVNIYLYLNNVQMYQEEVMKCQLNLEEFSYQTSTNLYGASFIVGWNDKELNAYFFVSKGDEIEWNMLYNAGFGEYWTNTFSYEDVRGENFSVNINSVTVY